MAEITVFDIVGKEAFSAIDELGYDFLEVCGYDVRKARKYPNEREKLARRMRAAKEEMRYKTAVERESGAILFWYVLYRRGKEVAKSEAIRFEMREGKAREGEV